MLKKIIITILFLCSFVSLGLSAEKSDAKQETEAPASEEKKSHVEILQNQVNQFGQELRNESKEYKELLGQVKEKMVSEIKTLQTSLSEIPKREELEKQIKEEVKSGVGSLQIKEEVKSEVGSLQIYVFIATIISVIALIGVVVFILWRTLQRSEVFPSSTQVSPDSKPVPEKEKSQSNDLPRILLAIDDLKRSLSSRQQDSSALTDLKIKINNLEDELKTVRKSAGRLEAEKDEAVQKQFKLMSEIAGVRSELTSIQETLSQEKKETTKYKTLLEKELAKSQEVLPQDLRQDPVIQEDLADWQANPGTQAQTQRLIQLLGLLNKSSEKLYPYILYELSVVLVNIIRQSGWGESSLQSRLQAWSKVLSRNSFGFLIQVPRLNERLTPQMVVSGRNSDGIVHKVNSWSITRQGNCVLSAEVE